MKYNQAAAGNIREDKRQFPGSFEIADVVLTKSNGRSVNITDSVAEIVIHESLEYAFMSGSVRVHDIKNLLFKEKILGNEDLQFTITDGPLKTELKFKTFNISDRIRVNPQTDHYTINFTAVESFQSQYKKISKSFINKGAHEIIQEMYRLVMDEDLDERRFYFDERSKKNICCVIPNWDLSRAANFVASRTHSQEEDLQSNNYVFFETIDGLLNFFPIEGLLDNTRNLVYADLAYDPLRLKQGGNNSPEASVAFDKSNSRRTLAVESLSFLDSIDHIANINRGVYANKMSMVDITQREVIDKDFNYMDGFYRDSGMHLKGPYNAESFFPLVRERDGLHLNPRASWKPIIKSKNLFTEENDTSNWLNDTIHKKLSNNGQLQNFALSAKMPGHLGLMSGMIVNLNLPDSSNPVYKKTGDNSIDKLYSGEYLVKSVVRKFTLKNFEMEILLVKDTVGQIMA